jgi:hypothetical protein
MEPVYDPNEVEERWQSTGEAERFSAAERDASRRDEGWRCRRPQGEALGGRFRP